MLADLRTENCKEKLHTHSKTDYIRAEDYHYSDSVPSSVWPLVSVRRSNSPDCLLHTTLTEPGLATMLTLMMKRMTASADYYYMRYSKTMRPVVVQAVYYSENIVKRGMMSVAPAH